MTTESDTRSPSAAPPESPARDVAGAGPTLLPSPGATGALALRDDPASAGALADLPGLAAGYAVRARGGGPRARPCAPAAPPPPAPPPPLSGAAPPGARP